MPEVQRDGPSQSWMDRWHEAMWQLLWVRSRKVRCLSWKRLVMNELMRKETVMPRDYLEEASDIIFGNKVPLAKLLETEPDKVVGNLLYVIHKSQGEMQAMIRKAAAYALGQIGEPKSMKQL